MDLWFLNFWVSLLLKFMDIRVIICRKVSLFFYLIMLLIMMNFICSSNLLCPIFQNPTTISFKIPILMNNLPQILEFLISLNIIPFSWILVIFVPWLLIIIIWHHSIPLFFIIDMRVIFVRWSILKWLKFHIDIIWRIIMARFQWRWWWSFAWGLDWFYSGVISKWVYSVGAISNVSSVRVELAFVLL